MNSKVTYIGFSDYHKRNCFEVEFTSEYDKAKFEMNFNMNNPFPVQASAVPSNDNENVVIVTFIEPITKDMAENAIENILNLIAS